MLLPQSPVLLNDVAMLDPGYNLEHQTIQHFWTIIAAWNNDYRAKLLRFVTGTAAVPPGGFAYLQGAEGVANFSIMKVNWDDPHR